MTMVEEIAALIENMLGEGGGSLELRRNDLADQLSCVPSQISYVIASRFTPERGYIVESRRGGGGCIRITKSVIGKNEYMARIMAGIPDVMSAAAANNLINNLAGAGAITPREAGIMNAAANSAQDDGARSEVMKRMIIVLS